MFPLIVAALVAWGALAFGAVHDWAVAPLAAGGVAVAAWQWRPRRAVTAVGGASLLVLTAITLQLVPLGTATLSAISPAAAQFLSIFDIGFANGVADRHALSIDPRLTARTLGYVAVTMLWVGACASALQRGASVRRLARNVAIIGVVLAVIGLAQKATFNGKLLWFWTPEYFASNSFGPFVNRNHFAGWMMLALSLTLGLAAGYAARAGVGGRASWRDRLLWLGTPAASPVLVSFAASLVMGCALIWTMSRSGILAAGCAVTVLTAAVALRAGGGVQRALAVGYAVAMMAVVVVWRGADALFSLYGNTGTFQWRLQLWRDTLPAVREFWVTGAGLNTYGQLMLVHPRTDMTVQPLQAHNDYLQLAVEGGVLVGVPVLVLAFVLIRRIVRACRMPQDPLTWWVRLGAVAGLCGMAVQEISEFSLQLPGVAVLFGVVLALAMHEPAPAVIRQPSGIRRTDRVPAAA
jgi:O-antigen ligase